MANKKDAPKKESPKKQAKNSLMERILKNSESPFKNPIEESTISTVGYVCKSRIPMMNIALSGDVDGGLTPGVTLFAGESKRFKTTYGLLLMGDYLRDNPDGIAIFYDSEFGSGERGSYLSSCGVDTSRVIHIPVTSLEELRIEVSKQLDDLYKEKSEDPTKETPKIFMFVDSIGNLASKKEMDDSAAGEIKAEVGNRAKVLKSFFRIISGQVKLLNIPFIGIMHTYKTLELFPKDVVGGGQGPTLGADNIFIIGKQQDKDGKDIIGYTFELKANKSRFVRENSKFPILVHWDGGIHTYSGLGELALEFGIVNDSGRSYEFGGVKVPKKTADTDEAFWLGVFEHSEFKKMVIERFKIANSALIEEAIPEDISDE